MLALSCVATFLTAYTSGSYSPPQYLMQRDLGESSNVPVLLGITFFCIGFGIAPMFLAPFSEMNGRYPVFVIAGCFYVVFQAVCGVVYNLAGMLMARFIVGAGASVFSTMVGGVIADMWDKEGRNTPMALFSGSVLAGTGAGPLVAAVMTKRLDYGPDGAAAPWKWIFWHQVIMSAALMVPLVIWFKESRGSVVLSRKAKKLNSWYEELESKGYYGLWITEGGSSSDSSAQQSSYSVGVTTDEEKSVFDPPHHSCTGSTLTLQRVRWVVKEDEERNSLAKMISVSVSRPFYLLFAEPVVFFFSLWASFAWGILYLTFGSIPLVYKRVYGWDIEKAGYIFTSIIIGAVLATAVGIWQEKMLHHPKWVGDSSLSSTKPLVPASSGSPTSSEDEQSPEAAGQEAVKNTSPQKAPWSDRTWSFIRRTFPADAPEARLYLTCISSALLPIGIFIFGFSAKPELHWIGPAIGITVFSMGIMSIYLAVFNYLADSYGAFASSALAAKSFSRNIVGGSFPLVTGALINNLGEAKAMAVLGSIAVVLTAVPWVLVFWGEEIRTRSKFATAVSTPLSRLTSASHDSGSY